MSYQRETGGRAFSKEARGESSLGCLWSRGGGWAGGSGAASEQKEAPAQTVRERGHRAEQSLEAQEGRGMYTG